MSSKTSVLPITGMTCANCVATLEKGLKKVPGVSEAVVNLALERASVTYDSHQTSETDLVRQVERVGYGVATATLDLAVTGMTCANCEATVSKGLAKLPGVLEANVNLATERARVTYVPGEVTRREMVQQIKRIGYGVVDTQAGEPEDAERAARKAEIDRQTRLLIVGAAFSLPLFVLSMARDFGWLGAWSHAVWVNVLMGALATPVQFYVGWQYYEGSFKALRNRTANMDVLVALGSSVAYVYSWAVTLGCGAGPRLL